MNREKIRELRQQKGLTTTQLGDLVGVSNVMISRIETGTKNPSVLLLEAIADALGVKTGVLVD